MKAIGVNYRNADVSLRGRLSFDGIGRGELRQALGASVILCTCNRTEIYFTRADTADAVRLLSEKSGEPRLSEYIRVYEGTPALRHLFRVASGIDSMILGEDEILRQVKEAYAESASSGYTDHEINTVFQAAFSAAKRVKTETGISSVPVSAATIAANEAARLGESVEVLMIGASGKIGSAVLKNLLAHSNVHVTQTARSHSAGTMNYENVQTVPYESRYAYMDKADCVISATSSPHFTVTAERLRTALQTDKPRLFIDLAVPPDIERTVSDIGGARLIGIDDLAELARQGNELRLSAAESAEAIISEETDELQKKLLFREYLPRLGGMKNVSFDELIRRLRDGLDSPAFADVLRVLCAGTGDK